MKNNIKKALIFMLSVMLVFSSMAMPVMADAELNEDVVLLEDEVPVIDSDLVSDTPYSTELSEGIYKASWNGINNECGGDSTLGAYITNNVATTWVVFDAGEGYHFTKAQFKVGIGYNAQGNWWINDMGEGNDQRIFYSDDAENWTGVYATVTKLTTPVPNQQALVAVLTTDAIPEARYVKIGTNGMFPTGHGIYYHNAKLWGNKPVNAEPELPPQESELLIDSDLVSDTPYSSELSEGIYTASWNGINNEMGGDSPLNTYVTNNAAKTWLVFDAGVENYYTAAEFKVSIHSNGQGNWWLTQMGSGSNDRIYYSDDAENWTGTYASVEMISDTNPLVANLKAESIPNARYIKIGSGAMWPIGNGLWYQNVKLWGVITNVPGPELPPEQIVAEIVHRDPCLTTILPQNDYITATYNDFQSQNWEVKWFDDGRATMILSNNAGDDVPDTITYAVKDTRHDIVSLYWRMIEQQLGISYCETPKITYSKDGIIWSEPVLAQKVSEASIPYTDAWHSRMVEYSVQVPAEGMKYVKLDTTKNGCRFAWIDVGLNTSTNALDMVSLADNTLVKADGEAWRATGTINCATEELEAATVILALYSGNKMVGVKPVIMPLENGVVDFDITANVGDATVTTAELYLWTSQLEMIPLAVTPIVVTAN